VGQIHHRLRLQMLKGAHANKSLACAGLAVLRVGGAYKAESCYSQPRRNQACREDPASCMKNHWLIRNER
jgi:hypothetical protein